MVDLFSVDFLVDLAIIALSILFLNFASEIVIKYATKVAAITRLSKTSIGFTLISLSTTLPELTVALTASLSGGSALSIGNAIGSNIFNISAILGIGAIILGLKIYLSKRNRGLPVRSNNIIPKFVKSELSNIEFGLFIASVVPLSLMYVSTRNTWLVGLILLIIFGVYLFRLTKVRITTAEADAEITFKEKGKIKQFVLFTVLGGLGVVVSANFMVESAITIATSIGIPQQVIGATIIALGTSIPELTIGVKSILRGHTNLALGNIIGSAFFNTTLILGVTLFAPALLGSTFSLNIGIYLNLIVFSIITNTFFWYFLSRNNITWKEGFVFLIIYALFIITTLDAGIIGITH